MMKIAKDFRWEMGHRLLHHPGKCKNLHGHSYRATVELQGDLNENGMIMDYYDLKKIVSPIIDEIDHSFLCCSKDEELIKVLEKINTKLKVVEFETTAEHICNYLLKQIKNSGLPGNVHSIRIRVYETESAYAESETELN